MNNLKKILSDFHSKFQDILKNNPVNDNLIAKLKELKKLFLGGSSLLKLNYQDKIKSFSNEEKKNIGLAISEINLTIDKKIKEIETEIIDLKNQDILKSQKINLNNNLFYKLSPGSLHPLQAVLLDVEHFFKNLGYTILDGQEVENNKYNFEYLNIAKNHPARNLHDSLFIDNNYLLRTHCTNMTARYLESIKPKNQSAKILSFGNVYRKDEDDATHSHQFMQVDVFNIGDNISLANLKWTLLEMVKYLFGNNCNIRLRPSYFPFTEPSLEVDINCPRCQGKGCSFCKKTGWIEILGAGMIHPNVIKKCGHNPKKVQGFAFGIGIERIVLIKYQIDDIRHLYTNDLKFLSQFRFD